MSRAGVSIDRGGAEAGVELEDEVLSIYFASLSDLSESVVRVFEKHCVQFFSLNRQRSSFGPSLMKK